MGKVVQDCVGKFGTTWPPSFDAELQEKNDRLLNVMGNYLQDLGNNLYGLRDLGKLRQRSLLKG